MRYLLLLFLFVSCTHKTESPVVVVPYKEQWRAYTDLQVVKYFAQLSSASDITMFCPKFASLAKEKQISAITEIIFGIIKYESDFDPNSRYQEKTMGLDDITHLPVYSEGLMQLSYGDTEWASFCEFDWENDKSLALNTRSIVDPYKNLSCGVHILANQTESKGSFGFKSGNYWAVLIHKSSDIANIVKSNIKECN